jgi:hypothetical protein
LRHKEVFVPLAHAPGDAQADFGEALVVIAVMSGLKKGMVVRVVGSCPE